MEQAHKYVQPLFLQFENTQIPEFVEVRSKDWIYYGEKNLWPNYIIELYQRSAKHNAIINGKVNYIIGGGFKPGANKWLEKVNAYETLKDLTQKLTYDLELFNGFAVEIIYDMKGRISEMYHIDFSRLRTNKDETAYYYSEDWTQTNQEARPEQTKFKEYASFDFNAKKKNKGSQLYVYTIKTPRKTGEPNVYPIPEYMGALPAIETDVEISNFHLTNIKTGFSAGTMVNLLNGIPTEEEAKKLEKKFKEKFTGTDKAGSLILNFAIDKEHAAEVVHMQPSDMDKQYLQMSERVSQEIFTGHKVTSPTLFGVMTAGALGQRNEMLDAESIFQRRYISVRQNIIETTFNKLASLNGMPEDIKIEKTSLIDIEISEQTIFSVLTADEKRQFIGKYLAIDLPPIVLPTTPSAPVAPTQMHSHEKEIQAFGKYGFDKNQWEILKTRKLKFTKASDLEIQDEVAKELFDRDDDLQNAPDNPHLDLPKGVRPTSKPPASSEVNLIVVYSYELRSDAPPLSPGGESRPFCTKLMDLNRFYKRSDLEKISDEIGYNVYVHKGGFYNNPETGETTPYCRHEWQQHVVTKKGV